MKKILFALLAFSLSFAACKKDCDKNPEDCTSQNVAKLKFKFRFDANQERLNSLGEPATIPAGHAAQTPIFHGMSGHLIELMTSEFVIPGEGEQVYKGAETSIGSSDAIDFDKAIVAAEDSIFLEIPIENISPATYEHIRVSVAYQNYDILYNILNIPIMGNLNNQTGRVASFVGFNTYIGVLTPNEIPETVNDDKLQGYWAFETSLDEPYDNYNDVYTGEAPAGATTVVNPFAGISDIPPGSCLVTGSFDQPLVITGEETNDITITLSFSINQSFEWVDDNGNGELDLDMNGNVLEAAVDMGLRGLKAYVN